MNEINKTVKLSEIDRFLVVENALSKSGFSINELRDQAKSNNFETLQAKLTWMVVSAYESSGKIFKD